MSLTVQALAPGDADASRSLGFEAFGMPPSPPTEPASLDRPGCTYLGIFDNRRLAGRLVWREYESWFGGGLVPTAGIAGVTVAAEYRGQGGLTPLFTEALGLAHDAGVAVSTLFPTASRIYRRFGYEVVGDYVTVSVPSWVLAGVTRTGGTINRRAELGDVEAIRQVYDRWAAAQNGPLSRRGVSFPATREEFLAAFTGVTVAIDGSGAICGFASWSRGQGYGEGSALHVSDLLATSADGYRALLATVGSFASVTPTTTIDTSGHDPIRGFLPGIHWQVQHSSPYMLKVLDVPTAVTSRRYPRGVYCQLAFRLAGDFLAGNDGGYLLEVSDGVSICERRAPGAGERTFTPAGLALLYAGVQSCANLRFSGALAGGDVDEDSLWDALFGGRQLHIRDYF